MGRILDPDWKQFVYVPAAKTDLRVSMEKYKERVFGENQKVHPGPQTPSHSQGDHGPIPSEPVNGLPSTRVIDFRRKT